MPVVSVCQKLHLAAFVFFKHNTSVQSDRTEEEEYNYGVNNREVFNVVLSADVYKMTSPKRVGVILCFH